MRRAALLAFLLLAGCLAPPAGAPTREPTTAPTPASDPMSCAAPAIASTGPYVVHAQLQNDMDHAACIHLLIDGAIIGAKWLGGREPALHGNPSDAGGGRASSAGVLVRIVETGTDHAYEERVTLGDETWVVGWLGDDGGNVEVYDEAPMWM